MKKTLQIVLLCVLSLVLTGLVGAAIFLSNADTLPWQMGGVTSGFTTPEPSTTPEPTTTVPNTTPEPSTTPVPTTTVPETTPEPQPTHYTLSFAGDCTLANVQGKTGDHTFLGTVKDNYAYPFADVLPIFAADDCTFINLECVLSDRGKPADKMFTFRAPPEYINILTEGSVEFAGVVNNHIKDYGAEGYEDTLALLDSVNIQYVEHKDTKIFTTESGLKIGVYAHNFPYETAGIKTAIKKLRSEGAEIVVVNVHWGEEYWFKPNGTQKGIAHYAIDGGADIVYGTHPHVLQPIEYYKDGVIFYSLGNFSFGGNSNPADKDTAILQVDVIRELDGTVHMGEVNIIPCHVSGILTYGNDYQPVPMDPETEQEAIARVYKKLNGTYEKDRLPVAYRDDLNPTTPPETTGAEAQPGEAAPADPQPEVTDAPPEVTDAPPAVTDAPPEVTDAPPAVTDAPAPEAPPSDTPAA